MRAAQHHTSVRVVFIACLAITLAGVPASRAEEDVTPPTLVSFSFSPTSVDVTTGPATVTVTVRVTDDLAGFAYGCFYFRSPSGQQGVFGCYYPPPVSGTVHDGVFLAGPTIPQFAEAGTWAVESLWAGDAVGNRVDLSTADLVAQGFPTQLIVTSEGLLPAAPQGLAGRSKDYKVNLTWQASANAQSYRVFRKLNGETAFSDRGVTGFTVFVDYLPAGTASAQYYVVAENSFGASPPSATITVTPTFR